MLQEIRHTLVQFFFIFAILFCSLQASAQVDPAIHWKVMHLPHFDLMYDAKHQSLADLYADRLEDNLQFLSRDFTFFPERTVVVLDDRTDLTNGYATPIPYGTIVLYPVLPGPQDTISDYGDWARELVMHEYTHILSFEPRRGVAKGLYYMFGNIITPNLLLPRWWLEGIAVDMETRNSDKGRLRSPFQDASIRAYVNEQKLPWVTLAEINESTIHTWPQGSRPYLFGSLMWSQMIADHGQKLIAELHRRYGGRMPYFVEAPIEDETGKDYTAHFVDMKNDLTTRASAQLKTLQKNPLTSGTTLTVKNGVENFHPAISPDGLKMIFLSKDDANKRSVRILVRPSTDVPFNGQQEMAEILQRFGESSSDLNPSPRKFNSRLQGIEENDLDSPPGGTIQRLAWFPDSEKFIFDKLDNTNRYHEVFDLYVFDLKTMKIDRLTHGERAREASVSPDGKLAAYVRLGAGKTQLAVWNLEEKKATTLYTPPLQARISFPTFQSSNEIVFSERYQGKENLKRINLSSGKVETLLVDYPDARFPQLTSQGLIFSSSRNGTSNLYLASKDLSSARPLTNTASYISSASLDEHRSDLYLSELTTTGFQIREVSLSQAPSGELPHIEPLLADRYPLQPREVPVLPKPEPQEYSALPYLWPRYWLPDLYTYEGGTVIGGTVSAADPLMKHNYTLSLAYDTEPKETSLSFLYANNSTPATILLKALDYRTGVIHTPYRFRQKSYEVDSLWEINGISSDFLAGFGARYLGRDYSIPDGAKTESYGPTLLATYSNLNMSGAQISPESGQSMNFAATEFLQGQAMNQENFRLYEFSGEKFFSKWLPRHHVIMGRFQGQLIDRNVSIANANYTIPYNPFANMLSPYYQMRGYTNGEFLGKSIANYSFEYRFPIAYPYKGWGTTPLFFKKLHAALVADGITLDGYAYNSDTLAYDRVDPWKPFWSVGAELKMDLTIGYHFPITLTFGFYQPQDSTYDHGDHFSMIFQM